MVKRANALERSIDRETDRVKKIKSDMVGFKEQVRERRAKSDREILKKSRKGAKFVTKSK